MPQLLEKPERSVNEALPRIGDYVYDDERGVGKIVPIEEDGNSYMDVHDNGFIVLKIEWIEGSWCYAYWDNLTPFDPS